MPRKRLRLFLTLLAISVILMILQNRWGAFRPFKFLVYPINLTNDAYVSARDYVDGTLEKYTLREEDLKRMERELRSARLKEQRFDELMLENQRLKEELEFKKTLGGFVAAARVVSRGSGRWTNAYVIDKGIEDFVEKDMAVVTPDGLVGKIQEAYPSYSLVLLIDDSRFAAGVRLESSRAEAVLAGAGLNRCVLKYVDADVEVLEGEPLVTSGLDGLFPPGIPAAYVTRVQKPEGALFQRVEAAPLVDTRKLEEVVIVRR